MTEPIKVKEDVIKGTSGEWTLADGFSVNRQFQVFNIVGNQTQLISIAMNAFGIPRVGEQHPSIFIQCVSLSAAIIDKGQVQITAAYRAFDFGEGDEDSPVQIRISGAVTRKNITEYIKEDGETEEMVVTYEYRSSQNPGGDNPKNQQPEVEKEVPVLSISFSRMEDEHPFKKAQQYLGKVNAGPWNLGEKNTWLCSRLEGNSSDGGETYSVDYEFLYNPESWDVQVSFLLEDGTIPGDAGITGPTGIDNTAAKKTFTVYRTESFAQLGLEI